MSAPKLLSPEELTLLLCGLHDGARGRIRRHIAALEARINEAQGTADAFAEVAATAKRSADEWACLYRAEAEKVTTLEALLDVVDLRLSGPTVDALAKKLKAEPHPGAALLEEHRKALVQAWNAGLRRAAEYASHDSDLAAHILALQEFEE